MANEGRADIEGLNYLRRLGGVEDNKFGKETDRPDLYFSPIELAEDANYSGYNPWAAITPEELYSYQTTSGFPIDDDTLAQIAASRVPELGYLSSRKPQKNKE